MIYEFTANDPKNNPLEWWEKVPALSEPRTFEFGPGLNVLWGRNGSGKSTVIKCLARLFHCEQSGAPVVTETSVGNLVNRWRFGKNGDDPLPLLGAVSLKHDGQGVRYFDPSNSVGLVAGGAAFDFDFISAGVGNATFKGSSGQQTMYRFDELLTSIVEKKPTPAVIHRIRASAVNTVWAERVNAVDAILAGNADEGPPTILLDEPERSLDLNFQIGMWRLLRTIALTNQVIVASHSLFALRIPEAHYIELSPGYLQSSSAAVGILSRWPEEPIRPLPKVKKPTKKPAKTVHKKSRKEKS